MMHRMKPLQYQYPLPGTDVDDAKVREMIGDLYVAITDVMERDRHTVPEHFEIYSYLASVFGGQAIACMAKARDRKTASRTIALDSLRFAERIQAVATTILAEGGHA